MQSTVLLIKSKLKRFTLGRVIFLLVAASLYTGNSYAIDVVFAKTGVDSSGTRLAPGSSDPNWKVVAGPGITQPINAVVVSNQAPGPYFQSANSRWIWINAGAGGAFNSPYTFRVTFDLTGLDPSTATISGAWSVDDFGSIKLNGLTPVGTGAISLTATGPASTFNSAHPFTINGGFHGGLNTLDFQATNVVGPGGINVSSLVGQALPVPEPETSLLLLCGLLLIAHRRVAEA